MEDNKPTDQQPDPDNNVLPASTSKPRNKRNKKSENPKQESKRSKKKSFLEVWRSYSRVKQAEFITAGLVAIGAVGYLVAFVVFSISQVHQAQLQHAPLMVNALPPRFLQPFTCDPERGFYWGNSESNFRNIGTATAYDAMPFGFMPKIVPEQRTGIKLFDELPQVDCDQQMKAGDITQAVPPGGWLRPQMRQGAMSLPPIKKGDAVQLYLTTCVYYRDEYGGHHGTCNTYQMHFPSNNPLDILSGTPTFACDGIPRNGTFMGAISGHCQK